MKDVTFPSIDYLEDVFSGVLDTCTLHFNYTTISQSGVNIYMSKSHHFDIKSVKFYQSELSINFPLIQKKGGIQFKEYKDLYVDYLSGCDVISDMFLETIVVNESMGMKLPKISFLGDTYFLDGDIDSLKLLLSSLNILCFDSGHRDYTISFMNDYIFLNTKKDVNPLVIEFINDHEFYHYKNQLFIKTNFSWCEKE